MLLNIIVLVLVAILGFWVADKMALPHPLGMILRVAIGLIILIALLTMTGLMPAGLL